MKNIENDKFINYRRRKYTKIKNKNFSIICNDCCGGCIYNDIGMRFYSPTINLYINNCDFLNYIKHIKEYNNSNLEETLSNEKYPIGKIEPNNLPSITLKFMHYPTFKLAKEKWDDRVKRINYNNCYYLFHLTEYNEDLIEEFLKLNLNNKILILYKEQVKDKKYFKSKNIILIKKPKYFVPGKILKRYGLFNRRYLEKINYNKIFK